MAEDADRLRPNLASAKRIAVIAVLVGGAACAVGALFDPVQFTRSWLPAWLDWLGVSLGCLGILLIHHLAGGRWSAVIRRLLEAGGMTVWVLGILSLPILLGMQSLYAWADPAAREADHALQHKSLYLNPGFFTARTVLYFLVWSLLALVFDRWSTAQDRSPSEALSRRIRSLAGPALLALGLTVTFASIDWAMSLEPHWFSSIYGIMFFAGDGVAGLTIVIVVLVLLARTSPMREIVTPAHLNDLGNLLLAFVMLWAYTAFSQYLIIWSGNLPEETPWYLRRGRGGWQWVAAAIVVFHFAVPFVVLLSRGAKRRGPILAAVALAVAVMRQVDLFWLVQPVFRAEVRLHWLDAACPIAIGGAWFFFFLRRLEARPVIPLHDHRIEEPLHGRTEAAA